MATLCLLEHVLLRVFSHSDVVELPPLLLEAVEYESVVMAAVGVSVMDTNGVKVVWHLLQLRGTIGHIDLLLQLVDLVLHLFALVLQL